MFLEWIQRHGDRVYNFAYRLAGNEADARDLVQDALVKAFVHRDRYDASHPFESWLMKILQNIYLDGVRRSQRRPTDSLDAPVPDGTSAWEDQLDSGEIGLEAGQMRLEQAAALQQALGALPLHYRTAVLLADVERMPYEAIAEVMDCPVGTVRSRVHQGRLLLKKRFSEMEGGRHGAKAPRSGPDLRVP